MATQGQQEAIKPQILGLLEIRRSRGLRGQAAINEWIMTSLEVLLQNELAKIQKREIDNA